MSTPIYSRTGTLSGQVHTFFVKQKLENISKHYNLELHKGLDLGTNPWEKNLPTAGVD